MTNMKNHLSLDRPEIQYICKKDRRFEKLVRLVGPISYSLHDGEPYEFVTHEIVEQMLSVKAGQMIFDRFKGLCPGGLTPLNVSQLTIDQIKATGMSNSKARSILCFTEAVIDGSLKFDELVGCTDEEVIKRLTNIHCIGPWTAKMYLLFVLGREDVLPVEDGAFLQTYRWLYKTNNCSKAAVIAKCKKWKPYSSFAARYFYRALDMGLTKNEFHLFKEED